MALLGELGSVIMAIGKVTISIGASRKHLLGHIYCFGRCGLSTAYFTEINE